MTEIECSISTGLARSDVVEMELVIEFLVPDLGENMLSVLTIPPYEPDPLMEKVFNIYTSFSYGLIAY